MCKISTYPILPTFDNLIDVKSIICDHVHFQYLSEAFLVPYDTVKGEIVIPGGITRSKQGNLLWIFQDIEKLLVFSIVDSFYETVKDPTVFFLF